MPSGSLVEPVLFVMHANNDHDGVGVTTGGVVIQAMAGGKDPIVGWKGGKRVRLH